MWSLNSSVCARAQATGKKRGLLIAFEGLDSAGKKSQAGLLADKLLKLGYEVKRIAFPDYDTPSGKEIRAFLNGQKAYNPHVRQLLYAANRWERKEYLESWLKHGRIVIADRYIPSGLAYGLASGMDLQWMLALEKGLPEPDLVIVLDVSLETAFKRKSRKDVYERDADFLKKVRRSYLDLAKKFGWEVVSGEESMKEVHDKVWSLVSRLLSA
jgi:dTMP kinase